MTPFHPETPRVHYRGPDAATTLCGRRVSTPVTDDEAQVTCWVCRTQLRRVR